MSAFQFQIKGLPAAEFSALFGLSESALHRRHQVEPLLARLLKLPGSAFVNIHYARAGCYAARASLA